MDKDKLDSIDIDLIRLLEIDARRSSNELAKQLHVSAATIRRRIRRLIGSEMIYIVALSNPDKTGLPLGAILGLNVPYDRVNLVMETLFDKPEIAWVLNTIGRFDIMCMGYFNSNEDLARFIKTEVLELEGTTIAGTFICLRALAKSVHATGPPQNKAKKPS